jgi:capsular exopolysaccharide synthesis family protein
MDSTRQTTLLDTIWRQRRLVIISVLVAAIAAAVIAKSLPKVYSTSSKLLIVQSQQSTSFDAIQAAQVTARTYSDVLASPNIARLVAERLNDGETADQVGSSISINPIPETQLLEISAEASTPARAKALADTYGQVFIDYASSRLAKAAGATVTIADFAPLIGAPSKPKPTLYVLFACLLAVPLSIGLALVRDRLDSRLRSAEQLEETFGITVLGRIPKRTREEASVTAFDEAFRLLRASLRFAAPHEPKTLAVTSAWEAEGKTTTSLNLASAAIEAGQRVLLVEADVYRPNLLKNLDPAAALTGLRGLTQYLAGVAELSDVIHQTDQSDLRILPAGPLLPSPSFSALLESPRGQEMFSELTAYADLVIFDCPPLGARADASLIAARTEGVLLVVDLKQGSENRMRGALRQLRSVNAFLIGAVVNRDTAVRPGSYEYHGDDARVSAAAEMRDLERT